MERNGLLKKILGVVLLAGVLCFVWTATKPKADPLPQPAYPLEEEAVLSALEQAELPWVHFPAESDTYSRDENHISYTLRDPEITYHEESLNTIAYAAVNSHVVDGERVLCVQFMPEAGANVGDKREVPPFAWEDWKQPIVFASLLYGGFDDGSRVYEVFSREKIDQPDPETGGRTTWETEVDGVWCRMEWSVWGPSPYHTRRMYELAATFYPSEEFCRTMDEREEQARREYQQRQEEMREAAKAANKE